MQSIFLRYLQANLSQSLKLPVTQFMGFKPMPKISVFQSIGYTAQMVYNRENPPEISHCGSKEKHRNK
jgi:hypothetical protein